MAHHHQHAADSSLGNARRLKIVFCLVAVYSVTEALGGWYTGSLALLADAGHMLSDVAALGVALAAIYLARRPAHGRRTFGLYRAEILGALINGVALVVIAVFIYVEAVKRFREPPEVLGGAMLLVAIGGLVVNVSGLIILRDGQQHSLNVRGAWLHMTADTMGSVGAIVSAILIWRLDWRWVDPAASVLIGTLVLWSSIALLKETVDVLLESAPARLDVATLGSALEEDQSVESVHDLHAWTIGSGREALTAHVVIGNGEGRDALLARLRAMLRSRFGLRHVTLQVEGDERECRECSFEQDAAGVSAAGRAEQGESEQPDVVA